MTLASDFISSFSVLGVRVHVVRMCQVLDLIDNWIQERGPCHYIVNTGMHGVMETGRNPNFKTIVDSAALFVPDGISLVWAARLRGINLKKRVSGPDLLRAACKRAEEKGHKVFFYGDTDETLHQLTANLKESFPGLKIVGVHSPPFRPLTSEEDRKEVEIINHSGADILWVGLGLPKQERWMFEHRNNLNVPVLVGVGAAFKFLSGRVKRAPTWVGDRGFEWLWRLMKEPQHIWRRVLIDGPHFVWCVVLESLGITKYGNPP